MVRILILILLPMLAGVAALGVGSRVGRRVVLVSVAGVHAALTLSLWFSRSLADAADFPGLATAPHAWIGLDDAGLLFLSITSALFLATSIYTVGYLRQEYSHRHLDAEEGFLFLAEPRAIYVGCMLTFLGAMSGVTLSQHFGLLWVFMEATTLASAPLIYFHRHHRSLEATWKYVLICSVGIALALLGNFLLAVSAKGAAGGGSSLVFSDLLATAGQLNPVWLQAAFVFMLIGYGTKMGLAPMHTWLPDAHSEAPAPLSALLSGALLNCAMLGIFRCHVLCVASGLGRFSNDLLVVFGLLSLAVATVFILRQRDYKRMLAYSSIEHLGIIALGVGLGGVGLFGAGLHAMGHSLTKAALFLATGNVFAAFDSKFVADVRGMKRALPLTGPMWLAGFLSIAGLPPFSIFLSEFSILKAALDGGFYVVAILYLGMLGLIFIGLVNIVVPMVQGAAPELPQSRPLREPLWSVAPSAALLGIVLLFGLWLPRPVDQMLQGMSASGSPPPADAAGIAGGSLGATPQRGLRLADQAARLEERVEEGRP